MLTILILLMAFASAGVLCSALFDRKVETMLPMGFFALVLVEYVLGLLGLLKLGFWLALLLSAACYAAAAVVAIRRRAVKKLLRNVLTPGFACYVLLFVVVVFIDKSKMVWFYDEFTHWGDVVKVMCQYDSFATVPGAQALFATYPPAMALLQYFAEKLHMLLGGAFAEDLLYMVYHWAMLSLFMPFISGVRRPLSCLAAAVCAFLAPMLAFTESAYSLLFMDCYLSILSAFVLAYAFWQEKQNWLDDVCLSLALITLVLTKDVGLLFALGGLAMVCYARVWRRPRSVKRCILPAASVIFAWASWHIHIALTGAQPAQVTMRRPIVLSELIGVFTGAPDQAWRRQLITDYIGRYLDHSQLSFWATGSGMSYLTLLIVIVTGLFVLRAALKDREEGWYGKANGLLTIALATMLAYIGGVLVAYMFKFSHIEARNLATWERYTSAVMSMGLALLVMSVMRGSVKGFFSEKAAVLCIAAMLLYTGWPYVLNTVARTDVSVSVASQAPNQAAADQIKSAIQADGAQKDGSIYLIEKEDWNDYLSLRYRLRPLQVGLEPWLTEYPSQVDELAPEKTPQELAALVKNYGYAYVGGLVDGWGETYAELFEAPSDIGENRLYRVDAETGLLVWMP